MWLGLAWLAGKHNSVDSLASRQVQAYSEPVKLRKTDREREEKKGLKRSSQQMERAVLRPSGQWREVGVGILACPRDVVHCIVEREAAER